MRFIVAGRTVAMSAGTRVRRGACDDIRNGRQLEIEGTQVAGGVVEATTVEISKKDDD